MWGAATQGAPARGRGLLASGSVLCPPCVSEGGGLTWLARALLCSGRASSVTAPGGDSARGAGSCLDPHTPPTAEVQSCSVMGPLPPSVRLALCPPQPRTTANRSLVCTACPPCPQDSTPFPLQYKVSSGASAAAGLELGRREQCWGGGSQARRWGESL